jgi:hypothetical protein
VKIVFAGPSLSGIAKQRSCEAGVLLRSPAICGDITIAVMDGAISIGLIDGCFETVRAVWHKEILYALSEGVHVFGGASMGALRAAECGCIGMQGVGAIYQRYHEGIYIDDADVAVLHGPEELDHPPLTETIADIDGWLGEAVATGVCAAASAGRVLERARSIFYKERTRERLRETIVAMGELRALQAIEAGWGGNDCLKTRDAVAVIAAVAAAPGARANGANRPEFISTAHWRRHFRAVSSKRRRRSL